MSENLHFTRNISLQNPQNLLQISSSPIKVNILSGSTFKLTINEPHEENLIKCLMPSFHIHSTSSLSSFTKRELFTQIKYGMRIEAIVTPEIIRTDKNLKNLKPHDRECFFEGERKLRFFKKYSMENCASECFTNFTLKYCNCTSLEQPYNPSNGIHHCHERFEFFSATCTSEIKSFLLNSKNFSLEQNCSCLSTCDSINYKINLITENLSDSSETEIIVRMKNDEMILYRRFQQFTLSDVISYVGGLLGLFAGISVLSFVEIFYFTVVRGIFGSA